MNEITIMKKHIKSMMRDSNGKKAKKRATKYNII